MFYKQLEGSAKSFEPQLIEKFDFWLATLPQKYKETITASQLSSRLNITLPTAKALLDHCETLGILAKCYTVKCSNCGRTLRKITQDELPDALLSLIRCDRCGTERFLPLDSVYTTYRVICRSEVL